MKNKIFFSALLFGLFFQMNSFAQTAYVRTFGGKFKEIAYDVKQTPDSGFVIVGSTNSFGPGQTSVYMVKTDSNGIFMWSKTFGGLNIDVAHSVQVNPDAGLSIFGYTNSQGHGGYDMHLIKTDALGNTLWEKNYGGIDWEFGYSHAILPDSGYILCGETYSYTNGNSDVYVIRADKNGDTLWTKHFGGAWDDAAYCVLVENPNAYVFVGAQSVSSSDKDALFLKLDANGNTLSTKIYAGTGSDVLKSLTQTNDGGYALLGTSNSYSSVAFAEDAYLVKTDNVGNFAYNQLYGNNGFDEGTAIIKIRNGQLNITGTQSFYNGAGGTAMSVFRVDASTQFWQNGAAFGGIKDETGYAMTLTNTGGIVYVGYTTSYGQGQEDFYFVKMLNDSIVANYTLNNVPYNDPLLSSIASYNLNNNEIGIAPNPFSTSTLITLENTSLKPNSKIDFKLFDMYGKLILQDNFNKTSFEIDRGNLPSGIYFYSVTNENKVINGKLIIN